MSALPLKADIHLTARHVRLVPIADIQQTPRSILTRLSGEPRATEKN